MMNVALLLASLLTVSPETGATVSLLKAPQRDYLEQAHSVRMAQFADRQSRTAFARCGGRPAAVRLEWKDDATPDGEFIVAFGKVGCKADEFVVTNRTSVDLVNLETGAEYEWKVSRRGGEVAESRFTTAAGPRLMHFPGVGNCRDLGGRVGLGGRRVRQGLVYRTAAYNGTSKRVGDSFLDTRYVPGPIRVTKSGRREMTQTCGIRTDLDLRNEVECAAMTASPLGQQVKWVNIPMRAYAWLENDRAALAKALRLFADEKNLPLAFHCAGGRDRAGSLAFVLGGLLGVGEDDLRKDWELSCFDTDDLGFAASRLDGLYEMLARYQGADTNSRIESFVLSCGLTAEEISRIRNNLLEAK